jgi:hypothetical protein
LIEFLIIRYNNELGVIILGYKRSFERHSWIHVAIQQNSRETFLNRHSRSWKTPGKQTNINRLQIIWLLSNCFFVLPIGPIQVVFRVFPANYQSQTLYYQHLLPGKNQICLVFNLNFMIILEHFFFGWLDTTELCADVSVYVVVSFWPQSTRTWRPFGL